VYEVVAEWSNNSAWHQPASALSEAHCPHQPAAGTCAHARFGQDRLGQVLLSGKPLSLHAPGRYARNPY
jgi:hypothetical protein